MREIIDVKWKKARWKKSEVQLMARKIEYGFVAKFRWI